VNGDLDSTFGINGIVNTRGYGVAIQNNGRIIVGGPYGFRLYGFNSSGIIDSTFGINGMTPYINASGAIGPDVDYSVGVDLLIDPADKILFGGIAAVQDTEWNVCGAGAIVRYNENGTVDSGFGGTINGVYEPVSCCWNGLPYISSIELTHSGNIGFGHVTDYNCFDNRIDTYTSSGIQDDYWNVPMDTLATQEMAILPDGKVAAVLQKHIGNTVDFFLLKAGQGADTSFGTRGLVTTDFGSNLDRGNDLAIQQDGKIVVVGNSGTNLVIARYSNCGALPVVNSTCSGTCQGSISFTNAFGGSPFTYQWSTGDTTSSIDSLCHGYYTVTLTNGTGCETSYGLQIYAPSASIQSTPANCFGSCDGTATVVNMTAGMPPYNYSWSNGESTDAISSLCSGTYSVIVTDSNLCVDTAAVFINEPTPVIASFTGIDAACGGECSGSFVANVSGGTPPYSYSECVSGTLIPDSLCAGNYCVTIADAHGCDTTSSFVVSEPPAIITSSSVQNPNCAGCYNGAIAFNVIGGVPPFIFNWSPPIGNISNDSLINLPAGIFTFSVTDATGCISAFSDTLIDQPDIVPDFNSQSVFKIVPNPTHSSFTIYIESQLPTMEMEILNLLSEKVYSASCFNCRQWTVDCSSLPKGIYFVKLKTQAGSPIQKLIIE